MSKTKSDILDLAEKLIRTKGYNAFSYNDISTKLNMKNAAIHYHFPTKKDLGIAVIERIRKRFDLRILDLENKSAEYKLNNFIGIYTTCQSDNMICFMGALGPSFETLPVDMQNHLTEASREIRGWLIQVLSQGVNDREFMLTETVEERADLIITSLLASLVLNKVTGKNILKNVINALKVKA